MTPWETIKTGEAPSHRLWMAAILVLCAVYGLGVNNQWAISPDGALYLTLGRSLAEGHGMECNGLQWWTIPPVLPFLIAACRLVAGDGYWLINLVLSACAIGAVVLAARTIRRYGTSDLALPVLVISGMSAYLYIIAGRVQTDVPFMLLVAAGLYGFARAAEASPWWTVPGGAALLAAALTRPPGVLFVVGAVGGLLLKFRRPGYRWWAIAAILTVVVTAGLFLIWAEYIRSMADPGTGDYAAALRARSFNLFDAQHFKFMAAGLHALPSATFAAITGQQLNFWVMAGPMLLVFLGLAVIARRRQWVIAVPVVLYVGFLLFWGGGAVARRYLLPVMPYLVYAFLAGVSAVASWAQHRWKPAAEASGRPAIQRIAVIIAGVICVAISVPKIARDVYWTRSSDFYDTYEGGKWRDVVDVAQHLRREGRAEVDVMLGPEFTVLHYLTRLRIETTMLAPGFVPWDPASGSAQVFAEMAVRGPARFVVVPTTPPEWSREALAVIEASGMFGPPVTFGHFAVLKRHDGSAGQPAGKSDPPPLPAGGATPKA